MPMENEKKPLSKEEKRKKIFRVINYTVFAMSAGVIEFVSFTLLTFIPTLQPESMYWVPATISLVLSVLWNFTLNRKFTFQSANNVPVAMMKTIAYYIVFAPLSIWFAQMYLVFQLHWNEFLVKAIVMIVNFVTEFLYQRFYVFKDSIDTKPVDIKKIKLKKKEKKED